jgi:hypothetical protein
LAKKTILQEACGHAAMTFGFSIPPFATLVLVPASCGADKLEVEHVQEKIRTLDV